MIFTNKWPSFSGSVLQNTNSRAEPDALKSPNLAVIFKCQNGDFLKLFLLYLAPLASLSSVAQCTFCSCTFSLEILCYTLIAIILVISHKWCLYVYCFYIILCAIANCFYSECILIRSYRLRFMILLSAFYGSNVSRAIHLNLLPVNWLMCMIAAAYRFSSHALVRAPVPTPDLLNRPFIAALLNVLVLI